IVFSVFVLFLLLGASCKAQSATVTTLSPEVKHRIVSEIRSRYHVGPDIDVTVSDPKPSNVPGYDQIAVTLSGGSHSSNHDFLISSDRKTLAYLDKIDLSNPMEKIDVKGRPVRGNPNAKVTIVN